MQFVIIVQILNTPGKVKPHYEGVFTRAQEPSACQSASPISVWSRGIADLPMISKPKICHLIPPKGLNKDAEDYFVSNMLRVDGNYIQYISPIPFVYFASILVSCVRR